jgi:uncharacterized protein YbaP (TraB family)
MNFRLLPFFAGLVFSASVASAESSVWKVTRGGNTLFLGGTSHVLRPTDFPLPAEFETAFHASSKLYFETDVARLKSPEMQQIVLTRGMITDGSTMEKLLTPAAWKAVVAYCQKAGLPVAQFSRMKPWLFTVMIVAFELQKLGLSLEGVDVHYHQKAVAAGKKTGELEAFERHMEYLVHLGDGHESEMIASSIEEVDEIPQKLNDLLSAWKSGNLARLEDLMVTELREKYPAIFKKLLVERNEAWLPKIEEMLKTPEVEFVLMGVGHLAGKEGLHARLRERGYTVEQIKATPAPAKK